MRARGSPQRDGFGVTAPPGTAGMPRAAPLPVRHGGQGSGLGDRARARSQRVGTAPGERLDSPPLPAPIPQPARSHPRLPRGSALAFRFPLKSGKLLFTRQREKFCLFSTSVRAASGYRAPERPGRRGRNGRRGCLWFVVISSEPSREGAAAPAGILRRWSSAGGREGMDEQTRGLRCRGHRGPLREMPTAPGCGIAIPVLREGFGLSRGQRGLAGLAPLRARLCSPGKAGEGARSCPEAAQLSRVLLESRGLIPPGKAAPALG